MKLAGMPKQILELELNQRLPVNIEPPCQLRCTYQVFDHESYYKLTLEVESNLTIICQRCLQSFKYSYKNNTNIAICSTEALAEKMLHEYETIVSENALVDLKEVLTDEMHLYTPKNHIDIEACSKDVSQYLGISS
jgi:uncharacterized protein